MGPNPVAPDVNQDPGEGGTVTSRVSGHLQFDPYEDHRLVHPFYQRQQPSAGVFDIVFGDLAPGDYLKRGVRESRAAVEGGMWPTLHVAGETMPLAVDRLKDRLLDKLNHRAQRRRDLRKRPPGSEPGHWRRGDLANHRPDYYDRPPRGAGAGGARPSPSRK